ncbi:DUF3533 domain-containing protein [soil metagenome]
MGDSPAIEPARVGLSRHVISLAIGGAIVALIVQMIFAGSYIGALHDPKPKDLPFGVVAPEGIGETLVQQIDAAGNGALKPTLLASEDELHLQIDQLDLYGGVVVTSDGLTLVVSDAVGASASSALTAFFQGYASAQGQQLIIEHDRLLEDGDPRGLTSVYLVFAWVFGGYFCATVLTTVVGSGYLSRGHAAMRLGLLAAYSVISGLGTALLAVEVFDALPGHFWEIAGVGALTVFAVATASMAIQLLLGVVGTLVVMIALVLIGNPSSGGVVLPEFLPAFWQTVGPWLPNSSSYQLLRNSIYFDGAQTARPILVLGTYALVGSALLLMFATRSRKSLLDVSSEVELAIGAAEAG